jgi:hypothetical protein
MTGCTSVGNLGIVTRQLTNNADRLKSGTSFEEFVPVEGSACWHFILAILSFDNSSFSKAVDEALDQKVVTH